MLAPIVLIVLVVIQFGLYGWWQQINKQRQLDSSSVL